MPDDLDRLADSCIFAFVKFIVSCFYWAAILAFWAVVYILTGLCALFWGLGNLAAHKPFTEGITFPYLALAPWNH